MYRNTIFKIVFLLIFISGLTIVGSLSYEYIRKYMFDIEQPYFATAVDVKSGSILVLDTEKKVVMAGVHIPYRESALNFMPELLEEPKKLLKNKKIKIELVERYRTGGFANYDLVRVYLENDICINDYLLKNGLAFFDHGYYRDKDNYFELEKKAKNEKKGIWKKKNSLKLLYVGSKHLEGVHYPECPIVNSIQLVDRIEYYERPPMVHWYRDWYPFGCAHCDEIKKIKPKHLR